MSIVERNIWIEKMRWKESIWKQDCPFCKQEEISLVIKEFKYWKIIKNKYPYIWVSKHILVVPYKHREYTKDLSKNEFAELKDIEKYMAEYFSQENYFSFIRQTNESKSIKHLHYHYINATLYSDKLETIL